ncbi:hypothetical protein ANN_04049 [Periplaneta americana]|uniref:Uncharacterized protein n=1 Tax=Periplaneta americana TaxID=6978 RepID=A0ABQ8T885_PERAM|nr:hypothetical protein ANN_04049 [Periplaneta americana]
MQMTAQLKAVIDERKEKEKKGPNFELRHLVTRLAVHGFHNKNCSNNRYHDPSDNLYTRNSRGYISVAGMLEFCPAGRKTEQAKWYEEAMKKALEEIKSSNQCSAIWPYNHNVFVDEDFGPDELAHLRQKSAKRQLSQS